MSEQREAEETIDLIVRGVTASAASAIEDARRFGVPLVVWKDGKIEKISPGSRTINHDDGPAP